MSAPRWARALLGRLAPRDRRDEVLGDLEEVHRRHVARHGRIGAALRTAVEFVDMAWALHRARRHRSGPGGRRRPGPLFSALDLKLGLRMLVRYPGMTVVAGLAIAFAVGVVTGFVEFGARSLHPDLPLPRGEDLVVVQIRNERGRTLAPTGRDFRTWRDETAGLRDWTAFRTLNRNLDDGQGPAVGPVRTAAITPGGLTLTGVAPLLGRSLSADDVAPGAPDVVVLGHDAWVGRFGADPDIVSRTVPVGARPHTVVGVMPAGFRFPVAHDAWTPLRVDEDMTGLEVFARLAPGADAGAAGAELDGTLDRTVGLRDPGPGLVAEDVVDLRVGVVPYKWYWASPNAGTAELMMAMGLYNLFFGALILMIAANVALLVFARAAARESEMVVREALGAGRRRIVGQLFAETLVLTVAAAALGLAAASLGVRSALSLLGAGSIRGLPFWMQGDGFSAVTVGYAVALVLAIALLTGVLPALRVTRDLAKGLRRSGPGGGGVSFGGVWTAVIVLQVTATAVLPVMGVFLYGEFAKVAPSIAAVGDAPVLVARLELDGSPDLDASVTPAPRAGSDAEAADRRASFLADWTGLRESLERDPDVRAVSFASEAPSQFHHPHRAEFPGAPGQTDEAGLAAFGVARVGPDYVEAMGGRVVAGRGLGTADFGAEARAVVVDESFVANVLGGRNAVGRPIRLLRGGLPAAEQDRTPYEIVGVVEDLGVRSSHGAGGVYRPAAPGSVHPTYLVAGTRGDPGALVPRLLEAARTVNPALRVHHPRSLRDVTAYERRFFEFTFWLSGGGSAVALFLSLMGIYSVLAFTVSRRTREIGVRVALGGRPYRIAGAIFRRPFRQVGTGLAVGLALAALAAWEAVGRVAIGPREVAVMAAYAGVMVLACLAACVVPTRRALAVEPNDALRSEG